MAYIDVREDGDCWIVEHIDDHGTPETVAEFPGTDDGAADEAKLFAIQYSRREGLPVK